MIYVFSPKKHESQKIFELLLKERIQDTYQIVVENMTGGAGKNTSKVQKATHAIAI